VQAQPLQREVQASAGEAQCRQDFPFSAGQGPQLAPQSIQGERQEDREDDEQAADSGDARRDVVAHGARHDPVSRPQGQRRKQHQPGGKTHRGRIIAAY